ncbi:MAG: acyltransferase [Lysobacteraceae bacterium]|nr:MAG: acyltransferase [Xanthomonadaceae bacterium]
MSDPLGSVLVPPRAPRRGNRLSRWIGRTLLRLGGWRVEGAFPDVDRLLIIVAPHSSAWDAFWGLAAKLALGLDLRFMAKAELFSGLQGLFTGPLLRRFGAIPTDRHAARGAVGSSVAAFAAHPRLWLLLAPEGTRKPVERWRTGFWHIARQAGVPVLCGFFHYPERRIGLGQVFWPSDDMEADMARLRAYYRPFIGRHRGTVPERSRG